MRLLSAITEIAKNEILLHYNKCDFKEKENKLTIDADTLLGVVIYMVLKTGKEDIYAHLKLAKQFSTSGVKQGRLGYLCSTYEVAIE